MSTTTTETATSQAIKHFKENQIILWHYNDPQRRIPVPGVIVAEPNDKTQTATIKIRNLSGQIQYIDVPYNDIEDRS